jgi:hypothetical protein
MWLATGVSSELQAQDHFGPQRGILTTVGVLGKTSKDMDYESLPIL